MKPSFLSIPAVFAAIENEDEGDGAGAVVVLRAGPDAQPSAAAERSAVSADRVLIMY
jgi:hypothetical protein